MNPAPEQGGAIFPIRPPHIPGEPACGYMLRLAEANGYDWRRSSFASRGIPMNDLAHGRTSALIPILGRETVERIERFTPRSIQSGKVLLHGETFQSAQILYGRQSFCVGCWADDVADDPGRTRGRRHVRCWWSVATISACPIHCIRLNDRCHECGRTNNRGAGGPCSCHCGADLSRGPRATVAREAIAADAYVVGRLGGAPNCPDPVLDRLPLGDAIALMQRLGCCLTAGRDARVSRVQQEHRPAMMLAGFEAIRLGGEHVEDAIEALLEGPGKLDQLRIQLGQFYCWFASLPKGELQEWLAKRIANVVRRNRISWQNWERHVSSPPVRDQISASQAKGFFDRGWDRTVAILQAAGLRSDVEVRCRPTIDRHRVETLAVKVGRLLDVEDLALAIGITPASVRKLSKAGILPPDPLARAASRYPKFDPVEIESLLARMAGLAPVVQTRPPQSRSVASAARSVGIVPLCRALLDGRIAACGRVEGRPGFQAIHIRTVGLGELRRPADSPWMGLPEGRRALGMRMNGLVPILASGHIRTIKDGHGHRLLCRADVDRFKARYVSTTELARARGTSAKALLSTLAAAGIHPTIEVASRGKIEVRLFEREGCESAGYHLWAHP